MKLELMVGMGKPASLGSFLLRMSANLWAVMMIFELDGGFKEFASIALLEGVLLVVREFEALAFATF